MSTSTWKLMLPALKKGMQNQAGFEVSNALLYMDNGIEKIFCILENEKTGDKYKGQFDPESMFAQMLLSAAKSIEGNWRRSTLIFNFEKKSITNQIYHIPEGAKDLTLREQTTY